MVQNIDLAEVEKKAFRMSSHEDGLLDMFLGFVFLSIAVSEYLGIDISFFWFYIPLLLIWIGAKKYLTYPRVGYARFSPMRKSGSTAIMALLLASTLILVIFTVGVVGVYAINALIPLKETFAQYGLPLIGVYVGIIFAGIAYAWGTNRFYGYGVLASMVCLLAYFSSLDLWVLVILASSGIILSGIVVMMSFIRKYSVVEEGTYGKA